MKKQCSRCNEWKPATTKHFYPTTSRGKRLNQWGEPYLRSVCRICKLEQTSEYQRTKRPKRTPEERERYQKMQKARRRAYQRLAVINEEGFKMLYAEELQKEGLRLDHYVGPTPRDQTDRAILSKEKR